MSVSTVWKERVASLVQLPYLGRVMFAAVRAFVPRHRIGVVMVLFNESRQVLLLRHVFHPTAPWGLPGGWLGRSEAPQDGILRELAEETGLTAQLGPVIHMEKATWPAHIALAFVGSVVPSSITLCGEIIEAIWSDLDDLPHYQLQTFTRHAIEAAVQYLDEVKIQV